MLPQDLTWSCRRFPLRKRGVTSRPSSLSNYSPLGQALVGLAHQSPLRDSLSECLKGAAALVLNNHSLVSYDELSLIMMAMGNSLHFLQHFNSIRCRRSRRMRPKGAAICKTVLSSQPTVARVQPMFFVIFKYVTHT